MREATPTASPIGRATPRVDGPLKVSGKAQYCSDFHFPGLLYAVPVEATIASGRVVQLDTAAAEKMPGVRAVFHRGNIGKISRSVGEGFARICIERRPPFEDDVVRYYGQYVALAVADTFETAKAAADAVRVKYDMDKPNVDPVLKADDDPDVVETSYGPEHRVQSERGNPEAAFAGAAVKLDQTYVTPTETHNPIELQGTTAMWDGPATLTIYEESQAVFNMRGVLAQMFGLPEENVRVITKFVGSGFGSKLWPWTHCPLAVAAARQLRKPVKLVLSRKMTFQAAGHRARTQQRVRLGATPEGKLVSLQHDYVYQRSMIDAYHENCGEATAYQYSVPNLRVRFGRAKRNIGTPSDMRGPGAVPGLYATESAMNELADQLRIDPVQLRKLNEPKIDEGLNLPFSSRHLVECFDLGAEKFGWSRRSPAVGSMKRDGLTLGWGMAGASWIAARFPASATVQLRDDGTTRVACGTQDIGTGTYTILAQLGAEKTGVPVEKVEVALGDTSLPEGPISGGSMATASVIPAVFEAADKAIESLLSIAVKTPGTPFANRKPEELKFEDGKVFLKASVATNGVPFADVLRRANLHVVTGSGASEATFGKPSKFSTHSFGCHFVEVTWQPEIARLRVSRVVTVMDAGRILNPLAGRNQIEGGVIFGIGMALFEHTTYDPQNGAPINASLADYIVPVNADVPAIEVHFLDYPDRELNPLGARGIGEIGTAGVAAAVTAAVHHATGVRVRELPVKIENLLA